MKELPLKNRERIKWRLGILAAIAMAFLALLPQFHLWISRGSNWQGTYVSFDFDEVVYSSYLNALISGRPRRNDPYTGRDDQLGRPQPESFNSIQFVPAYAAAIPARLLRLSAGTTFIVIRAFAAIATTLALFWLLVLIVKEERIAVAGTIIVLCLGGLSGEPRDAWKILTFRWLGESLPFLRRYVPTLAFPLFFVFIACVWQALRSRVTNARFFYAAIASLAFAMLIFSYFFLWTAALAWLGLVAPLWLYGRRDEIRSSLSVFSVIGISIVLALVPYAFLLSQRASSMDSAQLLTHSRAPLFSLPVAIGGVVLLVLAFAVWRRRLDWREPAVLFTVSFALLPVATFNQQIVTGLLLQPVHYSRYSANYISVLAAVLTIALIGKVCNFTKHTFSRLALIVAVFVFCWVLVENGVRAYRLGPHNSFRDDARRVAWRLRELTAPKDPLTGEPAVVYCTDLSLADALPNEAPQPILWTPHLFVFSGSTALENRERFYRQLYYADVSVEEFQRRAGSFSSVQLVVFGWERMHRKPYAAPITNDDVQKETKQYAEYIAGFDSSKASSPLISYVVVPRNSGPSLNNLHRWYTLDAGERVGEFMLYRATLR